MGEIPCLSITSRELGFGAIDAVLYLFPVVSVLERKAPVFKGRFLGHLVDAEFPWLSLSRTWKAI